MLLAEGAGVNAVGLDGFTACGVARGIGNRCHQRLAAATPARGTRAPIADSSTTALAAGQPVGRTAPQLVHMCRKAAAKLVRGAHVGWVLDHIS